MTDTHDIAPAAVARALTLWHSLECILAVICFSFIAAMVVYDVLVRELIGPISASFGGKANAMAILGSTRMAVYALIVGAFLGLGITTARGAQIVPKIAFAWVPDRWSVSVNRISDLFAGLFLLAAAYYAFLFVMSSRQTGMLTQGGIEFEVWIIQAVMPFGFVSVALRYLAYAVWPGLRPELPEFQE